MQPVALGQNFQSVGQVRFRPPQATAQMVAPAGMFGIPDNWRVKVLMILDWLVIRGESGHYLAASQVWIAITGTESDVVIGAGMVALCPVHTVQRVRLCRPHGQKGRGDSGQGNSHVIPQIWTLIL